jgi:protein arginine N-methyltransferase 5
MLTSPLTTPHFQSNVQALLTSYHTALDSTADSSQFPTIPLVPALTPADSPLIPHDSISQLLATTSTWIDLASPDPVIANISRQVFNLEIAYAAFCGIQHVIVQGPILFDGTICTSRLTQYARAIQEALATGPYLQIYIVLPMAPSGSKTPENQSHLSCFARSQEACDEIEVASAWSAWESWNVIRTLCNYMGRLTVGKRPYMCANIVELCANSLRSPYSAHSFTISKHSVKMVLRTGSDNVDTGNLFRSQ